MPPGLSLKKSAFRLERIFLSFSWLSQLIAIIVLRIISWTDLPTFLCGVRAELVYRVVQEERSMFWEMAVSFIVRKEARMSMCLIWVVTEVELFESPGLTPLYFCLWGWMRSDVYKREVDIRDELLASILDAAASIKKRKLQLRRRTHSLRTRLAKSTEVDDGILEY